MLKVLLALCIAHAHAAQCAPTGSQVGKDSLQLGFTSCTAGRDGLATVVSIERPTAGLLERFLTNRATEKFNHPFVGSTSLTNDLAEPEGWTVHEYGAVVGYGRECYERTRSHVLSWRVMEGVQWAGIHVQDTTKMIATFAKLQVGVGWAVNPCRQAYWNKDVNQHHGASIFSQTAYATLEGHLISGEERFLVAWDGREAGPASGDGVGAVHFSVRSVSRGSGILGSLVFPLLRPMQQRFFRDQVESVRMMVEGGKAARGSQSFE